MRQLSAIKLEGDAERVRREHADAIAELQKLPAASLTVLAGIELEDGVATPIAHGLGRKPLWVSPSAPRDATSTGRIAEVRSGSYDRSRFVVLQADGWGATITIDLAVM